MSPVRSRASAAAHLLVSGAVGLLVFALPLPVGGRWTVLFDVAVKWLGSAAPDAVEALAFGLIAWGAADSAWRWRRGEDVGSVLAVLRFAGLGLAALFAFDLAPPWLAAKGVGGLMWGVLVAAVALIVPLGAAVLDLLVSYGMIELVGTWMRPVMRPLFRLPGRAALDDLLSWLGSYSVGLYVTRQLFEEGRYTRRETFLIVTGFSTVSVGFVGVICATLELLHVFPLVFGTYFFAVYLLAGVQARIWPATSIPDEALGLHHPEVEVEPGRAWEVAMAQAVAAPDVHTVLGRGFVGGLRLAASILGTILAVGTGATLIAEHTPVFEVLGRPLVPVLAGLGLPDAEIIAPAVLAGITEVYIPALLVRDAAIEGRFFVAVLSISQLVFFSSVGPMMLEMFREVPIRLHHLLAVFALRTAILVPLIAVLTRLYAILGWL